MGNPSARAIEVFLRVSAPTWIALLDPFALHAPFNHLRLAGFRLVGKDLLCAIMTITAGVDSGSL